MSEKRWGDTVVYRVKRGAEELTLTAQLRRRWPEAKKADPLYPTVGISTPEQKSGERYKVIMVGKESPAAAAGFQVGDELVSIDGVAYTDKETVNRLMAGKRWGDAVDYKVLRNGVERRLPVHLRRQPPKPLPEKAAEAPR